MDPQSALVLAMVFGFVSGLVVGWVQGSAPQKARLQALELDLVQLKAHLMVMESDLETAKRMKKDSDLVLARQSEQVKELRSQLESVLDSEMEKLPESEQV
jgi:hypothetical protein